MLGLRFLGLRARLLVLAIGLGLLGAFSLVPLLPSDSLAEAYPRMALVVGIAAVLAALAGAAVVRPLEALRRVLDDRSEGRQILPTPDRGHDEVKALSDAVLRFLEYTDRQAAPVSPTVTALVLGERGLSDLLELAARAPGPGGARGAVRRLLAGIRDAVRLQHVSLLVQEPGSGRLELHLAAGMPEELEAELERDGPRPVRFSAASGVAGRAFETGRSQVAPRGYHDKLFGRYGGDHEKQIRSLAAIPMRIEGKVQAVLNAVNIGGGAAFDARVVDFLERAALLVEGWLPELTGRVPGAGTDPLTGVLPFARWETRLESEIDRVRRTPRALALAIVEPVFPEGEPPGPVKNRVLEAIGVQLREGFRSLDAVGREGNRFFLCMPETDALGALWLMGRVKERIDLGALELRDGTGTRVTTVVGVASIPDLCEDPDRLLEATEAALARAREAGDYRMACPRVARAA